MLKPAFVDLSHHNTIPASLVPAAQFGIVGVIHKLTEGSGYVDDKADNRFALANEAGLMWGLYHFVRPGDMEQQATFFCEEAASVANEDTLYCLDYEDKGVSLNDCITWLRVVEEITGHKPVLYSGHVLKEALKGKPNATLSAYRLWLAQYGPDYDLPPGWSKFWGWQYTESGSCPGINSPVDLNAYEGTEAELRADWSGQIGVTPKPPPAKDLTISIKLRTDPPDATVEILSVTIV